MAGILGGGSRKLKMNEYVIGAMNEVMKDKTNAQENYAAALAEKFNPGDWKKINKGIELGFIATLSSFQGKVPDNMLTVAKCYVLGFLADKELVTLKGKAEQQIREMALDFLKTCADPVLKLCGKPLRTLCARAMDNAVKVGKKDPKAILELVGPLLRVLPMAQPRPSCLTALHTILLRACLKTQCYHIGMRVLSQPVFEVDESTGITIEDYICYWYYAARVYIGNMRYKDALHALIQCIATPAQSGACSLVAVEAYQLLVLVSIIVNGRPMTRETLPKYIDRTVLRSIEECAKMYCEFGELFQKQAREPAKQGLQALRDFVSDEKRMKQFEKDKTTGLVDRCLKAFVRHKIASQTVTYIRLSLGDLTEAVGSESKNMTEEVVVDMISQGEISASIDQKDGVVAFIDEETPESGTIQCPGLLQKITEGTVKMLGLAKSLREKDEALTLNETYVKQFIPKNKPKIESHAPRRGGANKMRNV